MPRCASDFDFTRPVSQADGLHLENQANHNYGKPPEKASPII
jgi:hypothetical protein